MSFFMALLAKRGSPETGQSQSLNGDQSGSQRAFQRTARTPGMDTIKGLALIATFIGVLIIFAMWVSLWENVWQASVEPTRGAIYDARLNRLGPSPCLRSSWMWWRTAGCRADIIAPVRGGGMRDMVYRLGWVLYWACLGLPSFLF